jgi:hypothetical protein
VAPTMSMPEPTPTATLEFTLEEEWAVHQALLDHLERTLDDDTAATPVLTLGLLEKVESGAREFTHAELDHLEHRLGARIRRNALPDRDRGPAESVHEKVSQTCHV